MRLGLGMRLGDLLRAAAAAAPPAPSSTLLDDLVSYWALDEVSGTRADAVGDNDLTDNNTVGSSLAGMHNAAASFVSANGEFLSKESFANQTDCTIACWVNFGSSLDPVEGVFQVGAGNYDGSNTRVCAYLGSSNKIYMESWFGGANKLERSDITAQANTWYLLVMTYDATAHQAGASVNGDTIVLGTAAAGDQTIDRIFIGSMKNNGFYLTGLIDEVGWWSRVLTADEITELYALGAGKYYPFE